MRGFKSIFAMIPSSGNLYMDTRQSMSMMGPPGYPHMPPMSGAGPTMTGDMKSHVSGANISTYSRSLSPCDLFYTNPPN